MSRTRFHILTLLFLTLLASTLALPSGSEAQSNSVLMLLPTDDRRLELGGEFTGALSTSDYASPEDHLLEAWELEGRAGESVTVDLLSEAFDAHLYVTGPGLARTLSDDDGAGGCNARLSVTFLENGTFRVVASSFAGETGTYRIRVTERPEPAPSYGCGDVNPDVLAGLPTDGRTLALGSLEAGVLGPASRIVQDGRPGEAWLLEGSTGERLSVVLESDDFDAYLYLGGPGLGEILTDDDGAGDLDSMIDVTLPSDGPYTVVAAALSTGSFGAYTIRVVEAADPNELPLDGTLVLGEPGQAALGSDDAVVIEGKRGQVWGFEASAGQRVTIDLGSDEFDTYLYVVGPGLGEPLSDDDGGEDWNSRLSVTLPATGTYRIIASSFSNTASGAYTLTVR